MQKKNKSYHRTTGLRSPVRYLPRIYKYKFPPEVWGSSVKRRDSNSRIISSFFHIIISRVSPFLFLNLRIAIFTPPASFFKNMHFSCHFFLLQKCWRWLRFKREREKERRNSRKSYNSARWRNRECKLEWRKKTKTGDGGATKINVHGMKNKRTEGKDEQKNYYIIYIYTKRKTNIMTLAAEVSGASSIIL